VLLEATIAHSLLGGHGVAHPINCQGFVKGAYAAAIGTILSTCVLLGRIALGSLAVLFRSKVSNPLLIAVTAVIGLIAYPPLKPAWVMVKY